MISFTIRLAEHLKDEGFDWANNGRKRLHKLEAESGRTPNKSSLDCQKWWIIRSKLEARCKNFNQWRKESLRSGLKQLDVGYQQVGMWDLENLKTQLRKLVSNSEMWWWMLSMGGRGNGTKAVWQVSVGKATERYNQKGMAQERKKSRGMGFQKGWFRSWCWQKTSRNIGWREHTFRKIVAWEGQSDEYEPPRIPTRTSEEAKLPALHVSYWNEMEWKITSTRICIFNSFARVLMIGIDAKARRRLPFCDSFNLEVLLRDRKRKMLK